MKLATDVCRCEGKWLDQPDAHSLAEHEAECIDCRRRTDRSHFPQQAWIAPPQESPCPRRIAPITTKTKA